jgi:hypothetical protein
VRAACAGIWERAGGLIGWGGCVAGSGIASILVLCTGRVLVGTKRIPCVRAVNVSAVHFQW